MPPARMELDPAALYAEWLAWTQVETLKRCALLTSSD